MSEQKNIAVIGAGVVGLTCAVKLIEAGHKVIIIAKHWPGEESINYTSPWAGAHWRPLPDVTPQEKFMMDLYLETYNVMKDLAKKEPECSVRWMPGIEYLEDPNENYLGLKGRYSQADEFEKIDASKYPNPAIKLGVKYKTWSLNAPKYCKYLLDRFVNKNGGKTCRADLVNVNEGFIIGAKEMNVNKIDSVVNCSGTGINDPTSYPIRGQTMIVRNKIDFTATYQLSDGSWIFLVPRPLGGGTIVGGTKEANDWEPQPRDQTRQDVAKRAVKAFPQLVAPEALDERTNQNMKDLVARENLYGLEVVRDVVGRRPFRRDGLRVERQDLPNGTSIVHAYGAGGSGYEISWGIAANVYNLVVRTGTSSSSRKHSKL